MDVFRLHFVCACLLISGIVAGCQQPPRQLYSFLSPEGKIGYIDKGGNIVIEPIFEEGYEFRDGLAWAHRDGQWMVINHNGDVVFALADGRVSPRVAGRFCGATSLVETDNGNAYGLIDRRGRLIVDMELDLLDEQKPSGATVGFWARYGTEHRIYYIINDNAEIRVVDDAIYMREMAQGVAGFLSSDSGWGFVDSHGNTVISCQYGDVRHFSEGYCAASAKRDGPFGYIDKQGEFVIAPSFAEAAPFSEGLAAVRLQADGLWGFIDRTGHMVIEPQFRDARAFHGGLAAVIPNGNGNERKLYGYIDRSGQFVIPSRYDIAHSFFGQLAAVKFKGVWVYIDMAGRKVFTKGRG